VGGLLSSLATALGGLGLDVDASGAAWVLGWTVGVVALGALGISLRGRVNQGVWFGGLLVVAPLVLVLALGFQNDPRQIDSPLVGRQAPDFVLAPYDGGAPVRLSEHRGKPAVINFWATWCVPCKTEHPVLVALAQRLRGSVDFYGVVYQDTPEKIAAWLGRMGGGYPQLLDVGSKVAVAYGVYGVPETYVLDRNGVVTYKFTGPVDASSLLAQLQPLVSP
jgi:cytochrome c biogenesis protein CcmG/thiol:disulfide interchange protein DsbE